MELYLIRFALIGGLLAVRAIILVKGVLSSDGGAMVSAGYFSLGLDGWRDSAHVVVCSGIPHTMRLKTWTGL